jgi:hypothetical protein
VAVPRQILETFTPLGPSSEYSIEHHLRATSSPCPPQVGNQYTLRSGLLFSTAAEGVGRSPGFTGALRPAMP